MEPAPIARPGSFRRGLIFGLGFALPFMALLWGGVFILNLVLSDDPPPASEGTVRQQFGPEAGLTILDQSVHRGSSSLYVVGQIANQGTESWERIHLEVRLLDREDHVVGLCVDALFSALRPGGQAYFQIDCDKWHADAFPEYQRYTIEVVDASPEFRLGE